MSTLQLRVVKVYEDYMQCQAMASCTLPSQVKLTLHGGGIHANMPILSATDVEKIKAIRQAGCTVHYVNASYCCTDDDVVAVRDLLKGMGMEHVGVMAKICTSDGVSNVEKLLEAADGIVLGRGTIGLALPPEKVFVAQKHCLKAANMAGKIAVVTRVVDTMVHAPRPTRAEATDVANLVLDGADCILLGAETYRGEHPVEAVKTVQSICLAAEGVYDSMSFYYKLMDEMGGFSATGMTKTEALASSAVRATTKLGATMILAFTKTGRTARFLAKYRAAVPIVTVVAEGVPGAPSAAMVAHQCSLLRGVVPILSPVSSKGSESTDGTLTDWALQQAQLRGIVKQGERVVVSQCPRLLPDSKFGEAAVVKFVVAGETVPKNIPKAGSCMDIESMKTSRANGSLNQGVATCTPPDSVPGVHMAAIAAASQ